MVSSFFKRVWALCAKIPEGRVSTYGVIARKLRSKAFRAVGHALNQNPHGFIQGNKKVPCHRVVCSDGSLGGFAHGTTAKKKLLEKEGVRVYNGRVVDFENKLFRF
ncbi:MGMT family protein [Candidatus Micrarchaeota archaeon]|nr:MGMT family protein [Candidatus Micrarchaeota archaeon]